MADNIVVNETTYNDVEAVSMVNENGDEILYFPDAVRYNAQNLTEAQKAQARENIGAITEKDAPVKSVNNKTGAVSLNAEDVGARPNTWMPSAADVGARPNTWTPTAEEVGARPNTWTPGYSDVGADKSGTAESKVSSHNVSDASHNDIRLLIQGLADRINAIANSTDVDLDDFKEVVAYIKANRGLIDAITTNKINYTDIINDLATNVTNKPLSAAQGVALKLLIDNLTTNKLDASALTSAINTALAQAKASGEFKGEDGKTPYVGNDGYWYINGASTGVKAQGNDGKGISSVAKTSTNGLVDTYTITFTDGTKTTYTVTNGKDGYTPVKGTDYWTNADKNAIVNEVDTLLTAEVETEVENQLDGAKADIVAELIAQIGGLPVFGTVNDDKTITVKSTLSDGTYAIMYENEDGSLSEIGTITIENNTVSYINLVTTSVDTDGSIFKGTGYQNNKYLSSSTGLPSDGTGYVSTGYFKANAEYTLYIKGATWDTADGKCRIMFCKDDYSFAVSSNSYFTGSAAGSNITLTDMGNGVTKMQLNSNYTAVKNSTLWRMCLKGTGENLIISATPIE